MQIQPPTDCLLWKKPELVRGNWPGLFDRMSIYVEEEHEIRRLLQCRECGQLYFYEFHEEIDWVDGEDSQYRRFIPVPNDNDARELSSLAHCALLTIAPALCFDYPKEAAEPRIYWANGRCSV